MFFPRTSRQRFCTRDCSKNNAERIRDAFHDLQFVGVDGEGVNIVNPDGSKTHRYVMLSVGDQTLFCDGRELTHRDIFPFLYSQFRQHPNAVFVGFFLGYDFTMWLKSLPLDRAVYLFNPSLRRRKSSGGNPVPFPVYVDEWEIDMLGMKRFKIRPHVEQGKNTNGWMYICDTGAFFQTSFLNVIEPRSEKWPTGAPCSETEFETIKKGKDNRSNEILPGDLSYVTDMQFYNVLENKVLARTCRILNRGFVDAGVKLKRDAFYGPGQAIQLWLNKKVDEGRFLARKHIEPTVPKWAIEAFQASYYGGWFEIPYHGHIPGTSYEYDITSAYPHAMRNLPCLCGRWEHGSDKTQPAKALYIEANDPGTDPVTLVYARLRGSNPSLGCMPFRNPKGNILRPHDTTGWYFMSEIRAAQRAGLIDSIDVYEWIIYRGCGHEPPLIELAELFAQRLRIGKQTPAGKALKLMLNSAYGKFAQSIGTPKYGNPIYASAITSACRTMILDAIASHPVGPSDVLMVATDGIYFRTPHPDLDAHASEELGGWEPGVKHNLTLMKPGVYWDDKVRDAIRDGKVAPIKSRGISARSLSENVERIDAAFAALVPDITQPFPSLAINVPFSVTSPRLALARGKWQTAGAVGWDVAREDSASIAPKRTDPYIDDPYIRSHPMTIPPGSITTPYDRKFGYDDSDDEFGYTQEGSVTDGIADIGRMGA